MSEEERTAVREFLSSFEEVFGSDWTYTKEVLGIHDESPEQLAAAHELAQEIIYRIAPGGTFLSPGVDDETEDWGHRGMLLERYRRLRALVGSKQ